VLFCYVVGRDLYYVKGVPRTLPPAASSKLERFEIQVRAVESDRHEGTRVERRHRRHHQRAGPGHPQHVLEVDHRQRRLAGQQQQLPPLLESHVGGAVDEVLGDAVGDRRQRLHAAEGDDHPVGQERTAGRRRAEIVLVVDLVGQLQHRVGIAVGFRDDRRRVQWLMIRWVSTGVSRSTSSNLMP
jgi:hypothetical protein